MNKAVLIACQRTLLTTIALLGALQLALAEEPVKLVTGNDYQPYTDKNLPEGGLFNEIVMRAYDKVGVKYTIDWKPWKRGFNEAAAGKYLATYPYLFTEERNEVFAYSDPVYTIKRRLFMRQDGSPEPDSLEVVKGKHVCLPLGYAPSEGLAENFSSGDIIRDKPNDMATCFELLKRGRTDYVFVNIPLGRYTAGQVGMSESDFLVAELDVETKPLNVMFSRKAPNLEAEIERFNKGLAALKDSGEYDEIVKRHFESFGS